jgi:hypothetical protein
VQATDVLSALVALRGPSDVKSVPEPAGKQLALPDPLELVDELLEELLDELLEFPPLEEPPSSPPDPELDVLLDVAPVSSPPPELVELELEVEGKPELLLLLLPPLPDELELPKLFEPPEPFDPSWLPELPPVPGPVSVPPLAQ